MNIKNKSRLSCKINSIKFKDDDYETHTKILKDLLPFIEKYNIIYDPFYCNGYVKKEWSKLNKKCINDKLDAYTRNTPEFDISEDDIRKYLFC